MDHLYTDLHGRFFAPVSATGTLPIPVRRRSCHDIPPGWVYNLGAQSHVRVSFEIPEYTADVVGIGTLRILEAIHRAGLNCRFYQASSSEMFGSTAAPQSEQTVFHPRSPYGCAKVFGHNITINYRESYGMHASCGILFNHESPRRGETFVTRKITRAVARIKTGLQGKLYLGNLDALRDWGYAPDYVRAMWHMLQQEQPGDYVIGTGEMHSVREFCELAFDAAGMDWRGCRGGRTIFSSAEVDVLLADPSLARSSWMEAIRYVRGLVRIMVDADLANVNREVSACAPAVRRELVAR